MIHLEHPKTTSSIESEEVVSETKSSHEGVASEGSTRVENEPPIKDKEGVLQSTLPHGIKVGKLKQTTKDSPLAALFARQPPPEMKSESVNPPLSLNQPTRGDGKIKNDSLAQLIAGRPTLNVGVPKPITTTTSLPLAVPNSSRKIPIPPFPPGYSPPSSSSSQNQLKPAVSSTRIIPPPPTPPFNPADYMSKKLSPSIPALPVITKKKSPEYVSKHKPKCKMKGIFWNKLSSQQCSKSLFWSSITIKHLDNLDIDYGLLEESFCDTSMKTPSSTSGTPNSQISEKPKIITLFDSRRTQNILISLNKLKLTAEECVNLLVELNPQVLTLERCDLLMNLTPSSDEFKQLLSYSRTNNMTLLGKSEQFLYSLTRIYHLKERLECHKLLFTWNTAIDNLTGDINIINTACYELLHGNNTSNECKNKLLIIFSMILAVGNYMNSSSGGTTSTSKHSTTGSRIATGITLESILKLGTIKVSKEYKNIKKNYTLLHYIIYQLQVKYPESLTFYQNWKCVLTAGEISFTQIINEIIRLKKELNQIQEELNHLMMKKQQCYLALETTSTSTSSSITTSTSSLTGTSSPEEIHFLIRLIECAEERFQPFLLQGNNLLKHLQTNFLSVEKILQSTMEVFGENYTPLGGLLGHGNSSTSTEGGTNMSNKDLNDDKCQQFFKILSQIMILFQKIEQEIQSNELMRQKMMNKVSPSNEIQKGGRRISLEPQRNVVQENLFDNFRSNEDESPEKIVELFRSKFPLRR